MSQAKITKSSSKKKVFDGLDELLGKLAGFDDSVSFDYQYNVISSMLAIYYRCFDNLAFKRFFIKFVNRIPNEKIKHLLKKHHNANKKLFKSLMAEEFISDYNVKNYTSNQYDLILARLNGDDSI